LVIAKLRGSDQTVIRDVTDIDHPSTIASVDLPGWYLIRDGLPSFVSASAISYLVHSGGQLMRSPLSGSPPEVVAVGCGNDDIVEFGWSPDGRSFTYLLEPADWATNPPHTVFQWHLVSGGVDRLIGTAPGWCHCGSGSENSSLAVRFSPDGQFVWLVDSVGVRGTSLQVRRLDGSLVGTEIRGDRDSNAPTMGVWSVTDLFFRDKDGVERWTNGEIKLFLPGVAWLHPRASPKGGQITYAARGADGLSHVNVVDTSNGRARQLSSPPGTSPFFLSSRYVWYKGERLCAPGDPCYFAKTIWNGKTYIYDLQTDTVLESIITDIADVWPHGA
jgi:hypothetical protein